LALSWAYVQQMNKDGLFAPVNAMFTNEKKRRLRLLAAPLEEQWRA